jgi:hypothetical protein
MRNYAVAAFFVALAIEPASALELGLGGKVGNIGVGAGVGVGRNGVSVGLGANVGNTAGAKAGASVGKNKGSIDTSVGASGKIGSVGLGAKASVSAKRGSIDADVGASGRIGAVGVGAKASVSAKNGSIDADVGAGTTVGGLGGASAGMSAGTSRGSVGASLGKSGTVGGVSGGVSSVGGAENSSSDDGAADGTGGSRGSAPGRADSSNRSGFVETGIAKAASVYQARTARYSIVLPRVIRPYGRGDRSLFLRPFEEVPGTPRSVVRACREAIRSAATRFGAVTVYAISAGSLNRHRKGSATAPIEVRIRYKRDDRVEVRQARVKCHLDAAGRVAAVT